MRSFLQLTPNFSAENKKSGVFIKQNIFIGIL
jgi:hypothetical protein